MAWPENLTAPQVTLITNNIDQEFRPATLLLFKALANAATATLPGYLASPTGLVSTWASPAVDSVAGLLAALPTADIIPFSIQFPTNYALAQQLTVGEVITYMTGLNALVTSDYTAAALQAFSNIVGAPNMNP
jgi:hypothetical protein